MKQIEVTIMGQSYRLMCPEDGEASLRQAVANVDAEMSAIRDAGKVKARERIAVLSALNLAYRLADRPTMAPASPAASGGSTSGPGNAVANDTINRLVQRIDAALGQDGHLL
jgi:cell division protein ZapA